ncbi:MAG: STAS domain-containing protein [Oleispira sp.]|nr:STAS domain-containing protein [Oleispira sp.]MBL4881013.1 STAS domain-containing protein [Oleispira sp.]
MKNAMNAKLIAISPQQAQLSGRLDRLTAKELLQQGRRLIAKAGSQWQVDLAEVNHSSSVGIALLLDWLRYGQGKNVTLEFLNVPDKMLDVIEFSGLAEVFKLN